MYLLTPHFILLFNGPPLVRLMPFIFSFFFSHAHTRSYPLTCPPRVPYGCTTHTLFLPCNNEKQTNTDKKDPEPKKKKPPVIIWYAALLSETVFWAACAFFVVSQTSKSLHRRSRHPKSVPVHAAANAQLTRGIVLAPYVYVQIGKKKIPKERVMCSCQSAKWLKSKKQVLQHPL